MEKIFIGIKFKDDYIQIKNKLKKHKYIVFFRILKDYFQLTYLIEETFIYHKIYATYSDYIFI